MAGFTVFQNHVFCSFLKKVLGTFHLDSPYMIVLCLLVSLHYALSRCYKWPPYIFGACSENKNRSYKVLML